MAVRRIVLTVTASASRDPEINDFTLKREFVYRVSSPPTADDVRVRSRELIEEYHSSYPHRGRQVRTPVLDASIRERDR